MTLREEQRIDSAIKTINEDIEDINLKIRDREKEKRETQSAREMKQSLAQGVIIAAPLILKGISTTIHEVREFLKEMRERATQDKFIKVLEEKKWRLI